MTMDSHSREGSPVERHDMESNSPKRTSPELPSPAAMEPTKKSAAFSISSILGEDKPGRHSTFEELSLRSKSPSSSYECVSPGNVPTPEKEHERSFSKPTSPAHVATPPRLPPHLPHDAAKYNAFLAHLANPEVAKMYRWPLFWNPWMAGVQGAALPGTMLRPPFLQHSPIATMSPEGICQTNNNHDEERKCSIEAGEIVRPVACRRRPGFNPEDPRGHKNHFSSMSEHARLLHDKTALANRSPSPVTSVHRQPIAFPLRQHPGAPQMDALKSTQPGATENNKTFGFDAEIKMEKDNDLIDIEMDVDISDDETDENTSKDEDAFSQSNGERKKKTRTVFSRSQIFSLETTFEQKRYLSSSERAFIAKQLNMTETQVKIWFQNRRNKWKRQISAEMEAANMNQVAGQRLMQLPYMYSHEEISRGMRASNLPLTSLPPSAHPIVPPSVHHYYGGILRTHTS